MIAAADGALRHGEIIDGRYRIGRELGQGAMGIVYEAQHMRLSRRVAIKVLREELASDNDACERFEREARAAGRIGSQHIVNVHDAGELPNGQRYLVMEYLRGETLKEYYQRLAPVAPEDLMPIMAQLLDGLAAAHDAGIIHRDVKPENIYLVTTGDEPLVKIVDFGVSKFRDAGTNALKSRTGLVLGTPHYMSPEQARGLREVDRRADVFSAGIVLYEGLSGRRPFSAPNVNQLLFQIALDDVPPIAQRIPGIDPALAAIVGRATARDAARRYQSARQFGDDVLAWLHGDDIDAVRADATPTAPPAATSDVEIADEETREAALASLPAGLQQALAVAPEAAGARARPAGRARLLGLAAGGAVAAALIARWAAADPVALRAALPIPQLYVSPPVVVTKEVTAALPAPAASSVATATPRVPPPPVAAPAPPVSPKGSKTPRPFRKDL